MKAVIAAAGRGDRLGDVTQARNKCLLTFGGKTLLEHSTDRLLRADINDIIIVTGYCDDEVRAGCKNRVKYQFNPFFETTGILVSVWLARHFVDGEPFVLLVGDLLYDQKLLSTCLGLQGPEVVIPIDVKPCDAEDSKAWVEGGLVKRMGKDLLPEETTGEFSGIVKFSASGSRRFFECIESLLKWGRMNDYLMDAINEIILEGVEVVPILLYEIPRIEIDTVEDVEIARRKIFPKLT